MATQHLLKLYRVSYSTDLSTRNVLVYATSAPDAEEAWYEWRAGRGSLARDWDVFSVEEVPFERGVIS